MSREQKQSKAHPFPVLHELEVSISSLSNQGDGVAKIDIPAKNLKQWVIFVPFTIPSENVHIRITSNKKNCSLAQLVAVTKPSVFRIEPRCALYTVCGGCQYQHIDYQMQLTEKTAQIEQMLERLAGLKFSVNDTVASPREYAYRSKITPHFHKPYNGRISSIGFVSKLKSRDYLDIATCPIAVDEINEALPAIRQHTRDSAKSFKKDHTILLRAAEGEVTTNERTVIKETVNEVDFHFLAGDFFQNNPFILPAFVDYASKQAQDDDCNYLVDAYCGSGLFALTLAKEFKHVTGVEISDTATDWAKQNARFNGINNATFHAASAEAIFKNIDHPAEETTVLIDPPRAGCSADFREQLFGFSPTKVVYISCDPATQMRDITYFLDHGYQVTDVQPFDLFPQTKHLECIITLKKK